MKKLEEIRKQTGLLITDEGNDGLAGWLFLHGAKGKPAVFVVSWGGDWEHVSVSYANRVPTWEEMCRVKDMFWNEEECVVQYHPPKSEYVNLHPYCLHLWKPVNTELQRPPKAFA